MSLDVPTRPRRRLVPQLDAAAPTELAPTELPDEPTAPLGPLVTSPCGVGRNVTDHDPDLHPGPGPAGTARALLTDIVVSGFADRPRP